MSAGDRRVLILSQRNLRERRNLAVSALYEFEDAICAFDRAELLAPMRFERWSRSMRRWTGRAARKLGLEVAPLPRLEHFDLDRRYDVLLLMVQGIGDLEVLSAVPNWRQHCDVAICWVGEIWAWRIASERRLYERLCEFDRLYTGTQASVPVLRELTGRPVAFNPLGVDALRFSPLPDPPERSIDVFSLGRRASATHQALTDLAADNHLHYVYDYAGPRFRVHTQHRALMAAQLQRSRFFLANRAKADLEHQTHGQQEFGMRFFEGGAAGTVMLGEPPDSEEFRHCFDWPDALVDFPWGATHIHELMKELESDRERLAEIRCNNVVNCLRRYDWVYPWGQFLGDAGLDSTPEMSARREILDAAAARARRVLVDRGR